MRYRKILITAFILAVASSVAYLILQPYLRGISSYAPHHPAVEHPEVAGKRVVYREEVSPPVKAYGFNNLTDASGEFVSLEDLRGKVVLLGFIYTSCPDVCPLLTSNYIYIQNKLAEYIESDLVLVFITTDPERDDVETVKHYTAAYGGKWLFLTGPPQKLRAVWDAYGVFVEAKQEPRGVVVYHSYKTFLIDRNGMVRFVYVGIYNPADVAVDLSALIEEEG